MLTQPEILCGAAAALALGSYPVYSTFNPASSFWGRVICRASKPAGSSISLTFDDGPTENSTDRVLDLLGELNVRATFFVIGRHVCRCPELVRRMDAEGHLVANHSYDHGHFDLFRGMGYWKSQINRTDELIAGIIGKRPAIFRPPMGFTTLPIHHSARRAGQIVVNWSRGGRDGLHTETAGILARTMSVARAGDIVLLHDGVDPHLRKAKHRDRGATIAAIRPLVEGLRRRGLGIERLDGLLGIPGYAPAAAG